MSLILTRAIEECLEHVQKPTRYIGGEWNSSTKDWEGAKIRVALAYPDVYEIGQSHLGLRILYGLVNRERDYLAERVYAPWPDMENAMRERKIPLFSLESWRPLADFDLLGFSLQYELTYSNILNMLSLAGIPLVARERTGRDPLVVGGGPGALNAEPLADFFDFFLLGEAEEAFPEVLSVLAASRDGALERIEILRRLASIPGIYVPSFYEVSYRSDGPLESIRPLDDAPYPVKKRHVADLDKAFYPVKFVVPHLETVHDRGMLEILRGCTHGCRFCQAGMIYRPVRERSQTKLDEQMGSMLDATGFEEVSLSSLSSTDHSAIGPLFDRFTNTYGKRGVNVTLPSLRADSFSLSLAKRMQGTRKTVLTFAPEAGSERLRRVINKDLTEEDILKTSEAAFAEGWQRLKLYFMIGLPTEERRDLEAIAELAQKILSIGMRRTSRAQVTVSVSTFVPKAHTPFQWRQQITLEEIKSRQDLLIKTVRGRGLQLRWHQAEQSLLEGVFARGDRRLCALLLRAHELGCRFDGWSEWTDFDLWRRAFASTDIDPYFYANRKRDYGELLPWDLIDAGVSKGFLQEEDRCAESETTTPDCRFGVCAGCGACPGWGVKD